MDTPRIVKTITPYTCPHCTKAIFVCFHFSQPQLSWVLKAEDIEKAKNDLKDKVSKLKIDEKRKHEILAWVSDDNTFFGPEEVDLILQQLNKTSEQNDKTNTN